MTDEDMLERGLPAWFADVPLKVYVEVDKLIQEFVSKFGEVTIQDITYICCKVSMEFARQKEMLQ